MRKSMNFQFRILAIVLFGLFALHVCPTKAFGLDVVDASLNKMIAAATSRTAVNPDDVPRIKNTVEYAPYISVIRFPVQPGGKYTLTNVYPAVEDSWQILVTGYYPLSKDTRNEQGASGSVSGQRGARFTDTGVCARRVNLTISPKSQGKFLYVVYFSPNPGEQFHIQLSSPQTPDKEVDGIADVNPYTMRKNVAWGSLLGEFWSYPMQDEPLPPGRVDGGTTTTGGNTGGTTTGQPGTHPGDSTISSKTTVKADTVRTKSGATVEVPVRLLIGSDIASMNVVVHYNDETVTALSKPDQGGIFQPLSIVLIESNNDRPAVLRFGHATTERLSGSGVLATLSFRAIGQPGTRSLLKVEVPTITDSAGRTVDVITIDGEIIIESDSPPPLGNTNTSGVPTVEDARNALRMSVRLIPEDLRLDVDSDGGVTANDARILLTRAVPPENDNR